MTDNLRSIENTTVDNDYMIDAAKIVEGIADSDNIAADNLLDGIGSSEVSMNSEESITVENIADMDMPEQSAELDAQVCDAQAQDMFDGFVVA